MPESCSSTWCRNSPQMYVQAKKFSECYHCQRFVKFYEQPEHQKISLLKELVISLGKNQLTILLSRRGQVFYDQLLSNPPGPEGSKGRRL